MFSYDLRTETYLKTAYWLFLIQSYFPLLGSLSELWRIQVLFAINYNARIKQILKVYKNNT